MGGAGWPALLPAASAAIGALVVLLLEMLFGVQSRAAGRQQLARRRRLDLLLAGIASLSLLVAVATCLLLLDDPTLVRSDASQRLLWLDGLANASIAIAGLAMLFAIWLSSTYRMALRIEQGEYWALLLLAASGAFLAFAARNLMLLYLGLELFELPLYALVALDARRAESAETGRDFFLSGAFSSAFLLYGMALLYGATGHIDYPSLRAALDSSDGLTLCGLALLLAGLGFKLAWVPFHPWLPNVCERAPTPVAGFVCTAAQGSALLVVLRLVLELAGPLEQTSRGLFATLALLGIFAGGLMMLVESNLKRLLAWSSIARIGELTLALAAGTTQAAAALLFALLAHMVATIGAFGVLTALAARGREYGVLSDLSGIAHRRPGLAAAMTLFVFSLAGLPMTFGFWARFHLFSALVAVGEIPLLLAALVGALISLAAFLRVPMEMYMREQAVLEPSTPSTNEVVVLLACAVVVLYLGFFPDALIPGFDRDLLSILQSALGGA